MARAPSPTVNGGLPESQSQPLTEPSPIPSTPLRPPPLQTKGPLDHPTPQTGETSDANTDAGPRMVPSPSDTPCKTPGKRGRPRTARAGLLFAATPTPKRYTTRGRVQTVGSSPTVYGDENVPPTTPTPTRLSRPTRPTPEMPRALAVSVADTNVTDTNDANTMDELASEPTSPTVTASVLRRRRTEAARWRMPAVLSSTRSPLTKIDLRSLLLRPATWDALAPDEQKKVLALLPASARIVDGRPDAAALRSDDNFRHDCARFCNDLADGFFERTWLAHAFEAHAMRHAGVFDAFIADRFEEKWGVAVPGAITADHETAKPTDDHEKEDELHGPTPKRKRAPRRVKSNASDGRAPKKSNADIRTDDVQVETEYSPPPSDVQPDNVTSIDR